MNKKLYLDPELQILTFTQAEPLSVSNPDDYTDDGKELNPW